MDIYVRFYIDPRTGEPHILTHGVSESEALEILDPTDPRSAAEKGAMKVFGQTRGGRYLCVIFRENDDGILVITAYDLTDKARKAFRRRKRR